MKYGALWLLLFVGLLSGCSTTPQLDIIDDKSFPQIEIGRAYASGGLTIVYSNQEGLFGAIEYPDQRDMIVEHARTKNNTVQQDTTHAFSGLYGSVDISGTTLHYDSVFELSNLWSGSTWSYDRNYRRNDKHYSEDFEFVDNNQRMSIDSFVKKNMSANQDSPYLLTTLEEFCTRYDGKHTTIEHQISEQLGAGIVYMFYWDNGGEYGKYSTACFEHEDRRFEIVWMTDHYKNDITDVLAL